MRGKVRIRVAQSLKTISLQNLDDRRPARSAVVELEKATERVEIARGLIEMRKAGLLFAVHCHQDRLFVTHMARPTDLDRLSWSNARDLVAAFRARQATATGRQGPMPEVNKHEAKRGRR